MNMKIGTDTIAPRLPWMHPDALEERDNDRAAKAQALEDYVESWADDMLIPDAIDSPIQALIEHDSGLLQRLVADFCKGDAAELEITAGALARALIGHIKAQA